MSPAWRAPLIVAPPPVLDSAFCGTFGPVFVRFHAQVSFGEPRDHPVFSNSVAFQTRTRASKQPVTPKAATSNQTKAVRNRKWPRRATTMTLLPLSRRRRAATLATRRNRTSDAGTGESSRPVSVVFVRKKLSFCCVLGAALYQCRRARWIKMKRGVWNKERMRHRDRNRTLIVYKFELPVIAVGRMLWLCG